MIVEQHEVILPTPHGPMRTVLIHPTAPGKYPAVIAFSEIFQLTAPVLRLGATLASHGYLVALPEIFHELEPLGTVLGYTTDGTERGNSHKISKEISSYDADVAALATFLGDHPRSTGALGSFGVCIGGHLAYRAGLHPSVRAAACLYATDLHKATLGKGQADDSLARVAEIRGELLMIWGKQDPHIPDEGRRIIHDRLLEAKTAFTWHEFNAQHAFMRDEGARYDPALAAICWSLVFDLFRRTLSAPAE